MNRRKLLAGGAAALPLAVAGVSAATDGFETAIQRLFREWVEAHHLSSTSDLSDKENEPLYRRVVDLEWKVSDIVPRSAQDFALKLLMLTSFGIHDMDGPAVSIMRDARKLAGIDVAATVAMLGETDKFGEEMAEAEDRRARFAS